MIKNQIIKNLTKSRIKTSDDLALLKRKFSKKYKIPCPSNIKLLKEYHKLVENKKVKKSLKIENLLKTRPIRSLSGIVNVSVLTKPYSCPGKCLFCPQETGIPKSYVSGEPAVERAKKLNYDPYLQVKKRIDMLKKEGHSTDKIELRIVGGTWSYYPEKYQKWFVKRCFDACNNVPKESLEKSQKANEKAKNRIIGLSVETRPDFINKKEIESLRKLGATMVELGIQSVYDGVLKLNSRGHGVKENISATKVLKDAGFKVLYQVMPNLPGSGLKKDKQMFKELFQNPDFRPDLLKIYPCALLREAPLYKKWKKGKYRPFTLSQLINLLKSIKKIIPAYVRIQRIARDIPSQIIVTGGIKNSNLRQIIQKDMKKEKWKCKCIRCREVKKNYNPKDSLLLFRKDYAASGGKEIFLSFENKTREKLYSLLRLRIPSEKPFLKTFQNSSIIREIHTYGEAVPIAKKKSAPQHRGLGKKLIKEAEKITKKEFGLKKIAAISGIGARNYWRNSGYFLKNTYMVKKIK